MATGEKLKAAYENYNCRCRGCTTARNQVTDFFITELERMLENPIMLGGEEVVLAIKIQKLIDKTKGSK